MSARGLLIFLFSYYSYFIIIILANPLFPDLIPEIIVETEAGLNAQETSNSKRDQHSSQTPPDSVYYYNNSRIEFKDPWKIFKRIFISNSGQRGQGNEKIFPTPPIPVGQIYNNGNDTNGTNVHFGSPICIGNCLIAQIYWANSSISFFDQSGEPPSFPPTPPLG